MAEPGSRQPGVSDEGQRSLEHDNHELIGLVARQRAGLFLCSFLIWQSDSKLLFMTITRRENVGSRGSAL